jgi:hypothetical protein
MDSAYLSKPKQDTKTSRHKQPGTQEVWHGKGKLRKECKSQILLHQIVEVLEVLPSSCYVHGSAPDDYSLILLSASIQQQNRGLGIEPGPMRAAEFWPSVNRSNA